MNPETGKLEIHYIKSNDFRTVMGSGVFGGVTVQGQINMNFFSERAPIPRKIIYSTKVVEEGVKMDEIGREGKEGLVREVQCSILMDIDVAISFHAWLDDKIKQFQSTTPRQNL